MLDTGLGTGDKNDLPPEILMVVIGKQIASKQNWLTINSYWEIVVGFIL